MKILVLTNMYPPQHLGGYELSCRDTVRRWRARGHDVTVLTSDLHLRDTDEADAGEVRRELRIYWRDYEVLSPAPRERLRIERHNQRVLASSLNALRPDVVSVWHMGAMSLGLLTTIARKRVPMVFVIQDLWLTYGPQVDAWMRLCRRVGTFAPLVSRVLRIPTRVELHDDVAFCFISDWIRQRAIESASWALERNAVVYNGIDRQDFPGDPGMGRPWNWTLTYVGRVEERKGVHVALDALSLLPPDANLVIVGPLDGGYAGRLRQQANGLGIGDRVHFDTARRDELRDVYRRANVLLFPVIWPEPFGLVPLEAMACGTPVVATATGGSAEFLFDGVNCLGVPPNDASALARAVARLHDDRTLRDRVVRAGHVTADHLDVDAFARVLESWHTAATERFQHGIPADRPQLSEALAHLAAG